MSLFTIIAQVGGGTYLLQVKATSARKAVEKWAHAPEIEEIAPYVDLPLEEIRTKIDDVNIKKERELTNYWEGDLPVRGEVLILHIVGTKE